MLIFQTLEDRNNPDEVETNGPFKCRHKGAWMGEGYYFWDTLIKLAHRWGVECYNRNYIICSAKITLNEKCLDLFGNVAHIDEFRETCDLLLEESIFLKKELTVANVIAYLKENTDFEYEAIRAHPINSFKFAESNNIRRLPFIHSNRAFMDTDPAVQICLLKARALNLQDYAVIYPDEYVVDYI